MSDLKDNTAELTALQSALAETQRQLEGTQKALAESEAKVAALEGALEATPETVVPDNAVTFTLDKETYRFTAVKFWMNNTLIDAREKKNDKAFLAKIVKDYPGVIEKI